MIHLAVRILQFAILIGTISSCLYYILCLWSAVVFLRERENANRSVPGLQALPPASILKPLKGTDPEMYESFRSHCLQEYPEYETIFGVSDPGDSAISSIQQLQREFPDKSIRLVICPDILGANVKVSNLAQMVKQAKYEYLVVNDSDIRVERDYLRRVIAPLTEADVGVVTCLYRGVAAPTVGSKLEALGISTDFSTGVLAALALEGGISFGLGSTLAFRRADLEGIGGFEAIVDYLGDDYELGHRISQLGKRVELSQVVVETHLPAYDLGGYFDHQFRWARGVRDARSGGYFGLIVTFGLLWSLLCVLVFAGASWAWALLVVTLSLRAAVAWTVGSRVLRDSHLLSDLWLLPVRDLLAVVVWVASFGGHSVTWRGERFGLRDGKLIRIPD